MEFCAAAVKETERLLIDRTLQGRTDAFGDLVQPHLTSLHRLARMRLQSKSEAEDVVQQAVLRAFSHLRQFRREASFKTWLSAITFHEVSQLRRTRAIGPVGTMQHLAADVADPTSPPDVQCQRRQDVERLHQAVTRLPEKYRRVIQLRDLHELSIAETAQSLSLSVGVIKTRHHRARKLLVRWLAGTQKVAGRTPISMEEQ